MLFSSCQKWVWNWFWVSVNFTLCSLREVFHLLQFERIVLFKRCQSTTFRDPQLDKKAHIFLLYRRIKNHEFITMDFIEISEESFIRMQFQGFPPSFSSYKCSTKACIFWEASLIGPGWHCFSVWPTAAA